MYVGFSVRVVMTPEIMHYLDETNIRPREHCVAGKSNHSISREPPPGTCMVATDGTPNPSPNHFAKATALCCHLYLE